MLPFLAEITSWFSTATVKAKALRKRSKSNATVSLVLRVAHHRLDAAAVAAECVQHTRDRATTSLPYDTKNGATDAGTSAKGNAATRTQETVTPMTHGPRSPGTATVTTPAGRGMPG